MNVFTRNRLTLGMPNLILVAFLSLTAPYGDAREGLTANPKQTLYLYSWADVSAFFKTGPTVEQVKARFGKPLSIHKVGDKLVIRYRREDYTHFPDLKHAVGVRFEVVKGVIAHFGPMLVSFDK